MADPKPAATPPRPTYTTPAIPTDVRASQFLGNPALDNVVSCLVAMNAEMWALRRRLHVMQSVMSQKGITAEMVEQYVPSATEEAAWEKDRDRFVSLTLGHLGDPSYMSFGSDFPAKG
ncbi:MAG: hypothetical protein R3E65_02780 [Steroidobacteraceae bacterium]